MTDKQSLKRGFGRAAPSYERVGTLQREVREELLSRFEYFQIEPEAVLDLGCGTGVAMKALHKTFSQARIIGIDIAIDMLRHKRRRFPWLGKKPVNICGDMEVLPLPDNSIDCIFSSLALQWSSDPVLVLNECQRVLKPGGLLHVATLGGQTLTELRQCFEQAGENNRIMPFHDVQHWGSALMAAGLEQPVLDVDRKVLFFADGWAVMRHLQGIGATNHRQDRPAGLSGRKKLEQVVEGYEQFRRHTGVAASFEVVYAHAWKPQHSSADVHEADEIRIPPSAIGRARR